MTLSYRPRTGSVAQRALDLLGTFPPGTQFETSELAKRLGVSSEHLGTLLETAVRGGAITKSRSDTGTKRSPTLWSLGDGVRLSPATMPRKGPHRTPSEETSKRFNFRLNADVQSHAARLSDMRHPAAPKPADADPVITPRTRITVGPSYTHDPRVQCAPGEQPFGAGFAAAGIGRDLDTGRAWR